MKFTKIAAVIMSCTLLMTGCASSKTAIKAGDVTLSKGDVEFLINDYNSQTGNFETAKTYALDSLKKAVLVNAVAKLEKIELSDEEKMQLKSSIAQVKSNYGGLSAFDKMLKEYNAPGDFVSLILSQSLYESKLQEKLALEDPTDDELKKYMKENYRRAKHVLIQVGEDVVTGDLEKSQAEDILKKAQEGADFDKLIKEHSDDPGSAANPDGYVFTDNQMVKEFQDGVDSIKPGEFTMVKSDYGYHVIQRLPLDESDSKFEELFNANKDAILTACGNVKFEEKLESIAKENGIELVVDEEVIASITEKTEEEEEEITKKLANN